MALAGWIAGLVAATLAAGCQALLHSPAPTPAASPQGELPRRQRWVIRERIGDPWVGLAIAAGAPGFVGESLTLAHLWQARLQSLGQHVESHVGPTGLVLFLPWPLPQAREGWLLSHLAELLLAPPTAEELAVVEQRLRASPPPVTQDAGETSLAVCAGELLFPGPWSAQSLVGGLPTFVATLDATDLAIAIVGPPELAGPAAATLKGQIWPRRHREFAPYEPLPVQTRTLSSTTERLGLGLWGVPAGAAARWVQDSAQPGSLLQQRLARLTPGWTAVSVSNHLHPVGSCVRLDLEPRSTPRSDHVDKVGAVVEQELRWWLSSQSSSTTFLEDQALRLSRPEAAAAALAWQALHSAPAKEAGWTLLLHTEGPLLSQAEASPAPPGSPALEVLESTEPGQAALRVLLASPCGTLGEDDTSAGGLLHLVHVLAEELTEQSGLSVEPWVDPSGIGLQVTAYTTSTPEDDQSVVHRVADTLVRAVLGAPPRKSGHLASSAADITPEHWAVLLKWLSQGHPSWLVPRGGKDRPWAHSPLELDRSHALWRSGPLRLAVLSNRSGGSEHAVIAERLAQVLTDNLTGAPGCPSLKPPAATPGRYLVRAPALTASVLLGFPVAAPSFPGGMDGLEQTRWLLNEGGQLEQALASPGLVARARAHALGTDRFAALIIELSILEGNAEDAIARLRSLWSRLRAGSVPEEELSSSVVAADQRELEESADPQQRLARLWRSGAPRRRAPVELLRELHTALFPADGQFVVVAQPKSP